MANDKFRIGVVGCGIGLHHTVAFQNLSNQFEVMAICDLDEAKASQIAACYHIPRVITDFAELCVMDDVDILSICTPSYLKHI